MRPKLFHKIFSEDTLNTVQLYSYLYQKKYSFFLESAEGEEKIGRFSILGWQPLFIYILKNNHFCLKDVLNSKVFKGKVSSPFSIPRQILKEYRKDFDLDLPFLGGWVGFISYEFLTLLEPVKPSRKDLFAAPYVYLLFPKNVFIFDHFKREIHFLDILPQKGDNPFKILRGIRPLRPINPYVKKKVKFSSNFKKSNFVKSVRKAKKLIRQGEVIQVVLSQLLKIKSSVDPFLVYRALRILNPSPYMFFLKFSGDILLGSSPEMLVKKKGNTVFTCPIAGTRPRGKTDKEDKKLERELKRSVKEKAEHLMLVDLGRNDLGRVCKSGSVKVESFMDVERYSHVMHLVSRIQGKIKSTRDSFSVLEACFPAGTVSGAPKVRASQVISELEPTRRGPYAGCVGYFDLRDNMDTCITIRSLYKKANFYYIQSGAGIVYDSQPQREYEEIMNKAKSSLLSLEIANANNTFS